MSERHTCQDQAGFVSALRDMFDRLDPDTIRQQTSGVLRDMIETIRQHQARRPLRVLCFLIAVAFRRRAGVSCICEAPGARRSGAVRHTPLRPMRPVLHASSPTHPSLFPPKNAPQVTLKSTVSTVVVTTLVLEGWSSRLHPDLSILDTLRDVLATDWRARMSRTVDRIMTGDNLAVA